VGRRARPHGRSILTHPDRGRARASEGRRAMSDTPAIEPLPPALEEAARSIAHEWMERLGYAPGIPEQAQRWLDAGEHEDFDAVYDLKKTLRFVRFVLKRVPRDPTAELVEFLERIGAFDENLEAANSPELLPCFNQRLYDEWKQLSIAARAALARMGGGELGEGW